MDTKGTFLFIRTDPSFVAEVKMSQRTLDSFFAVRKRPVDQHPSKKRKLDFSAAEVKPKDVCEVETVEVCIKILNILYAFNVGTLESLISGCQGIQARV